MSPGIAWKRPRRVVVLTLAFGRPEMVERALAHLEGSCEHYIVDVGYPLPDPYENAAELIRIAERHGSTYIRIKNRSVGKNWTWLCQRLGLQPGDVMLGLDPDSRPDPGWTQAVLDVFEADSSVAMVTLTGPHMTDPIYNDCEARHEVIAGRRVLVYPRAVHWSLMTYEVGFILDCGGLGEDNPVYGYTETWAFQRMWYLNRRAVMLADFNDLYDVDCDPEYKAWKKLCAEKETQLDFSSWLQSPR